MNLCIDQGNSSTKIGIFEGNVPVKTMSVSGSESNVIRSVLGNYPITRSMISSVTGQADETAALIREKTGHVIVLSHDTKIPFENRYQTPETLGKDRVAAIAGAAFLKPGCDVLVIDAGSAITYDFIDKNNVYHGGNIAPGMDIRLRSLHGFTEKLPLVAPDAKAALLGNDTRSAIASGVLHGIIFEIDGYISSLKIKYPELSTFLTGGSTFYFHTKLKNPIFAEKNLVLIGLNRILQFND